VTIRLLGSDGVFMKMISAHEVLIGQFGGETSYNRKKAKKGIL